MPPKVCDKLTGAWFSRGLDERRRRAPGWAPGRDRRRYTGLLARDERTRWAADWAPWRRAVTRGAVAAAALLGL